MATGTSRVYPCHCKTFGCKGAPRKASTRQYHLRRDERATTSAASNSAPDENAHSQRISSTSTNILGNEPLRPCQPPNQHSDQLTADAAGHSYASDSEPPCHDCEPHLLAIPTERDVQEEAEQRGQTYIQSVLEDPSAVSFLREDIGDASDDDGDEAYEPPTDLPPPHPPRISSPLLPLMPTPLPIDPGDPPIPDDNFPDPFYLPKQDARTTPTISLATTPAPIFLLYILVSWLHTQFHLPFVACNVVLVVVFHIIRSFNTSLVASSPIYVTLSSVLLHLGVEPSFIILPVCPVCLEVHPPSVQPSSTAMCTNCSGPLFQGKRSLDRRTNGAKQSHRPLLQFPIKSIQSQLEAMLAVPGMEDELELWRTKPRSPGVFTDNFDGDICKTLPDPQGRPFFENPRPAGLPELRIGLTLGLDWFSYLRSQISASHSSGPMSFNVINLRHHLRYRVINVILAGIMPGPREQNPDQVQRFLRPFVNELLRLWRHGFIAKTDKHPLGILIRVILVCVICDKPAAHKVGGFGSHSHTFFCTRCWIMTSEKATAASFQAHAFRPRTHSEQFAYACQYRSLATQSAQDDFVRSHATRWFELARLPYFDCCRMVVVDPMHNLLLGLVKTHFYHIWIQQKVLRKTRELRRFHDILSKLHIPSYLGRLPSLMGIPAGGSLTADQWLIAATIVCPIAIPQIWAEYCTGDAEEVRLRRIGNIKAAKELKAKQAATKRAQTQAGPPPRRSGRKRQRTERAQFEWPTFPEDDIAAADPPDAGAIEETHDIFDHDDEDDTDATRPPNLHPQDAANFAKLAQALHILLAHEITLDNAVLADQLLRSYGLELIELYGPDIIRPNHHYATHIFENIKDFGPLHGFWTFLFERINKVLKAYKTSNHAGGELETSFFREFHRTVEESRVLATSYLSGGPVVMQSIAAMYAATADNRGTIQALARELDEANEDGGLSYQLSPNPKKQPMSWALYAKVLNHLRRELPFAIRSHTSLGPEKPLHGYALFADYVIISQRRYYASSRNNNPSNSLVAALHGPSSSVRVCEILDIILLDQPTLGILRHYAHVRWLVPADTNTLSDVAPWNAFAALHTQLWMLDQYDASEDVLMDLTRIQSHAIRADVTISGTKYWLTILPS